PVSHRERLLEDYVCDWMVHKHQPQAVSGTSSGRAPTSSSGDTLLAETRPSHTTAPLEGRLLRQLDTHPLPTGDLLQEAAVVLDGVQRLEKGIAVVLPGAR